MFPSITAALTVQFGFMMHTQLSTKVQSFVESAITGIHTAAVGEGTLKLRTVGLSTFTSYRSCIAVLGIVVTEVSCSSLFKCFSSHFQ